MVTPLADITNLTLTPEDPVGAIAQRLIQDLCAELSVRYGTPPSPFSPAEVSVPRTAFLVGRLGGQPVGCGAIRRIDNYTAEVKRMYVAPPWRRKGVARRLLAELERRAKDYNYQALRLETGIHQPEARQLYESCGYRQIAAYGHYAGNPTSVCYEKLLTSNIINPVLACPNTTQP